ncbi:DUF6615 family protein [Pandoraea communis]|uniref:DUF6615 family protein n=1 Tax=Pandoraea communis TaxID=2508297 RepID=UPI0027E4525B|nr:DUF6615 family protein [Pandoraea communis]
MLCQITQWNARWIWRTLRDARKYQSKIGEESVTDFLVLQLKQHSGGSYYIDSFTRHEEKLSGADWELWITGPSRKWLGLRVQAKVISIDSKRYAQLHYKRKDGSFQVDQLVVDAKRHKAFPLYCLYSYWKSSEAGKLKWPCGTLKKNARLFGASWISVRDVRHLKVTRADDIKSVAKLLHPFHCLFCCGGYGGTDLPTRAAAFLQSNEYTSDIHPQLLDEPPYYVLRLIEPQADDDRPIDINDSNLFRVTVVKENDSERSGNGPVFHGRNK